MEEIHHQAHVAAATARRPVGGAAALFLLAFEQDFAAGGRDHILVVAQHFERGALGRQHIGDAGQRAFDLSLLVRREHTVVHRVTGIRIGARLQRRQRHCKIGIGEFFVGDDERPLVALGQMIVGTALDVGGRHRRIGARQLHGRQEQQPRPEKLQKYRIDRTHGRLPQRAIPGKV
ncbi:hypothetical protein NKI31_05560 [Mesorhizobium sp. M0659]|uniref:hypothetical protein n=1 Tax=Mesorhizobium sp. M0659 TaxID=2956980 RepID=UPI003336D1E8